MALDFGGAGSGDGVTLNTNLVDWLNDVPGGSSMAWMDWNAPANIINTVFFIDRGGGSPSARMDLDISGFAPVNMRLRVRALDSDSEFFAGANGGLTAGFRHEVGTFDAAGQEVQFWENGLDNGTVATTTTAGNFDNTDPASAEIGQFNGGSQSDGRRDRGRPLLQSCDNRGRGADDPCMSGC